MQTEEATMSLGDNLRAFFTKNPDAGTVATARQFECDPGYVSSIKKGMGIARPYRGQKRVTKPVKKLAVTTKRQQIIQYFRENPDASPAVVAKKFDYSAGAVSSCKKIALEFKPIKSVTYTDGTFKNGAGWGGGSQILSGTGWLEHAKAALVSPEVAPAPAHVAPTPSPSPWADYGLWMDREQLRGYLLGRAVEYLTKGDKLSIEEALRCVTKLAELTGE
jgi:hypothetical protein